MGLPTPQTSHIITSTEPPDVPLPQVDTQPARCSVPSSSTNDTMESPVISKHVDPSRTSSLVDHANHSLTSSRVDHTTSSSIDHVNPSLIDHAGPRAEPSDASPVEHTDPTNIPMSQGDAQPDTRSTSFSMDIDTKDDTVPPCLHLHYSFNPNCSLCRVSRPSGMFELPEKSAVDSPPMSPADSVFNKYLLYPEDDEAGEVMVDQALRLSPSDMAESTPEDTSPQAPPECDSESLVTASPSHPPPAYPPYALQGFEPTVRPWLPTPPESTASPLTTKHLALDPGPSTLSAKDENPTDSLVPPDPKVIEPFTAASQLGTPLSVIISRSSPIIPWVLPEEVAYAWAGLFYIRSIEVRFYNHTLSLFCARPIPDLSFAFLSRKASRFYRQMPLPQH